MSGFLDKMKHLVVEDDPNAVKEAPAATTPVAAQPQPTSRPIAGIPGIPGIPGITGIQSQPVQAAPVHVDGNVQAAPDDNLTQTYVGKLREKFATSPYSATLNQFMTTMESLSEDLPQEGSRFRAALKVMQSSPDKLIEAFNSLLTVLDNEAKKFQSSVAAQKTNEVDAREGQVQQINAQIENKNKEIQSLMEQRDGIATDIVTAKKKLGAISASFEGAVASLQSEVGDSLQKLRIYFPATSAAAKK